MPHIFTSRFLKDIPYTETQFAEAFNYIFQKKIDYTIVGNNITVDSFGVFANGYFIIGVGSETITVTQNGYLIIEYQRNETLNTEVFSSVYYSSTIPTSSSVNKYGVLGEVYYNPSSNTAKLVPYLNGRSRERVSTVLLDSGTYNVNDTLGIKLDDWKEIEVSFQSSAIARYKRSAEDPLIFWGTGGFVDGTPNQVTYGGNIAKVGSNWILKASVQTRHRGGAAHDANANQPIYNIRGVERI